MVSPSSSIFTLLLIPNRAAGQHGRERHRNQRGQNDGDSNCREPCVKIRASFRDLIDDVEAILNSRKSDRGRPERGNNSKGQLAAAGGSSRLVEGSKHRTHRRMRNDDSKIVQKLVIDARSGLRSEPQQRTGAEQSWEEGEDEIEPKFGSPP